jgi:hypothetical protein
MQIPTVREFIEHEISQQNVDPRLVQQIMAQGDSTQMGRLFGRK